MPLGMNEPYRLTFSDLIHSFEALLLESLVTENAQTLNQDVSKFASSVNYKTWEFQNNPNNCPMLTRLHSMIGRKDSMKQMLSRPFQNLTPCHGCAVRLIRNDSSCSLVDVPVMDSCPINSRMGSAIASCPIPHHSLCVKVKAASWKRR